MKAIKKMHGIAMIVKRFKGKVAHSPNPAETGRGMDEGEKITASKFKRKNIKA